MLNSKKRPAVLIFGWLGAKPYNINKVARLYSDFDIDHESYIQTPESLLSLKQDTKGFNNIYEMAMGRPIICHVFSLNGASALYKSLTDKKGGFKPNLNIKGLIFDCTPGHPTRNLYHTAFSNAIFPKSPKCRKCANFLLKPAFDLFLLANGNHRREKSQIVRACYSNPFNIPTMLMTSKKDNLIKYTDVLEYANELRKRNIYEETHVWEDSPHVAMYRDHNEEYKKYVNSFVKKFLFDDHHVCKTTHL